MGKRIIAAISAPVGKPGELRDAGQGEEVDLTIDVELIRQA